MIEKNWLKEYADKVRKADAIDPALYRKYGVKRGLRNDDGTGVLVGLTTIGNVHGYVVSEGEKQAVPGQLFYRGINVADLVAADRREHRYGYEEAAYLLLSATCRRRGSSRSGRRSSAPTGSSRTASRRTRSSPIRRRTS